MQGTAHPSPSPVPLRAQQRGPGSVSLRCKSQRQRSWEPDIQHSVSGQERGAALTQRSSCPTSSPVTSQRGQKPGAMGRSGGKAGRPGRGRRESRVIWARLEHTIGTTRLRVIPATWWQSQAKGHHGDQFSELRGQVAPPPGAPLEHALIHGRAQSGLGLGPGLTVNAES